MNKRYGKSILFFILVLISLQKEATAQISPCADGYIQSVIKILRTKKDHETARNMLLQMKKDCSRETLGKHSRKSLDSLIDLIEKATGKLVRERINDRDGDGFADETDKCPDIYSRFNNGCPAEATNTFTIQKMPQTIHVGDYISNVHEGRVTFITKDTVKYDGYAGNDLLEGMGYITYPDGDTYTGEFKSGHLNGYGVYTYGDGSVYTGFWMGNQYNGIGKLKTKRGIAGCEGCTTYTGYFKNGLKTGPGRCYDAFMHLIYEGVFENDLPMGKYPNKNIEPYVGKGIEIINQKAGGRFMGYTRNGKEEGKGTYRFGIKQEYVGEWENGLYEGDGSFIDDGIRFTGDWKKGIKSGFGTYDLGNGIIILGAFKNDLLNGQGAILTAGTSPDIPLSPGCRYFVGNFAKGRKEGQGRCYNKTRKLIYDGVFTADKPGKGYPAKKLLQ